MLRLNLLPITQDAINYCFNGEIYNFKEIKDKIPDYSFKTHSDTEVLLAAYLKWETECLQHLKGMFCFCNLGHTEKKTFNSQRTVWELNHFIIF